jgi:hypothetical protein
MTYRILHEKNGTIIVTPSNESSQTATIVICHGLGDTAEGFADVAEVNNICVFSMCKTDAIHSFF